MRLPQESLDNSEQTSTESVVTRYPTDRAIDYSEYMWMGEEMEEFDRQCLEEILEDDFIEDCFEEMLAEEDEVYDFLEELSELAKGDDLDMEVIMEFLKDLPFSAELDLNLNNGVALVTSDSFEVKLNPNAPEFIPRTPTAKSQRSVEPLSPFDSPPTDR